MKKAYLRFLKKIRKFRKSLLSDKDIKRGKMYFSWLEIKTEIKDYEDGKILLEECKKRKSKLTAVIQLDNIYRFKKMTRWADITRMKKISLLRLNFSGTIGKVDGKYIDEIYKRIVKEF